jgi:hypothetical protein
MGRPGKKVVKKMKDCADTSIDRRKLLAAAAILPIIYVLPAVSLIAQPAPPHGSKDFDFLTGCWNVSHRKLKVRLQQSDEWIEFAGTLDVKPILAGNGNIDENVLNDPAGRYLASSLRVFDSKSLQWSIYWVDERFPGIDKPVVGRFDGGLGRFYTDDNLAGQPIRVRFTYQSIDAANAIWTQAFSANSGGSWETNWIMKFSRDR